MNLSIGVVADDIEMLHRLRSILTLINSDVASAFTVHELSEQEPIELNLWLVVSRDAADAFDILCDWNNPQIFLADDMPSILDELSYQQWQYRLKEKLSLVLNEIQLGQTTEENRGLPLLKEDQYEEIWVIAASLGGPEAVSMFFSKLDKSLPIAFIYAQHIEESFVQFLPDVLNKESQINVLYGDNGLRLKRGQAVVYPSHQYSYMDQHGVLHVENKPWAQPYTPNIDQVIDNAMQHFPQKMGVIVFSGMCDDGAASAFKASKKNIPIWAQEPEECICSSMPDAVIEQGCVSVIGSAVSLAEQLNQRFKKPQGE